MQRLKAGWSGGLRLATEELDDVLLVEENMERRKGH
jgi:hypothetical protein